MSALAPLLTRLSEERLFLLCVAGSLGAHALILETGWQGHLPDAPVEVEFDLTAPDAALGPAGKPRSGSGRAPAPPAESWMPAPPGTAPSSAAAEQEAPPGLPGDAGAGGAGDGGGGSGVTVAPRLLDQGQLDRLLTRYYPESERRQGHEGVVLLDLSIDEEGHVVGVEVVASSDPAFEPAARKAAARLGYAPARAGARPVSVKIRQPVQFRLSPR
ncbi:MAG: TonB family protein [Elusimicrobiota bacterium]|nr:TonB family protein [Elusimicrobiota bacterium]